MSVDEMGRPTKPVMTGATVIVMNRGATPADGQGMIAISPGGCFYLEVGLPFVRAMSLDEFERHIKERMKGMTSGDELALGDLILSTIATCRGGGKVQ